MNITMSPQQPMLSVTKAIPFQSGIFADVWRVTQERYYQVKKVCRSALINPALICKGEVVNAACAIDSESMNQTVELGQVRSSRLAKAGDLSSAVGFNIKLNDCDTNVSSNAAVAFLGTTVTSNDDTLALQSSAAGSAQNVGIQILDRTGEVLILDGATFSAKTDLIDGTNILPFQARYIALGQSVAGTANADATFKVQYL